MNDFDIGTTAAGLLVDAGGMLSGAITPKQFLMLVEKALLAAHAAGAAEGRADAVAEVQARIDAEARRLARKEGP